MKGGTWIWALAATTILWGVPRSACAQTTLAWKLQPGDHLALHTEQQSNTTATVVGKTVKTSVGIQLDSLWLVEDLTDGTVRIKQTVSRVQATMQAADAPLVSYDSADAGQPSGAARDLAAALAPLVDPESSILLTMNERGEILSVELSPKLKQLTSSGAGNATQGNVAAAGLETLLKQPLVTLPDGPVEAGGQWKVERELDTPAGKYAQTTTYSLEGEKELQGKTAAAIAFDSTLKPVQTGKTKLKEQSQSGTVYFDAAAGRMISSEQKQRLVTETPYRDATITVEVVSEVKRTFGEPM